MKKGRIVFIPVLAVVAFFRVPAIAMWNFPDTDKVPIERLVANLQEFENSLSPDKNADRARVEFQIGRLYSMAYARKTSEAEIAKRPGQSSWQQKPDPLEDRLKERIAATWKERQLKDAKLGEPTIRRDPNLKQSTKNNHAGPSHRVVFTSLDCSDTKPGGKTQNTGIVVEVGLSFHKKLKSTRIYKSSGDDVLDQAALSVVQIALHNELIASDDSQSKNDRTGIYYHFNLDECLYGKPSEIPPNLRPYYGVEFSSQFPVEKAKTGAARKAAKLNLESSIIHLRRALQLNPDLRLAQLGLAWCYDQSGEKDHAVALYREVFKSSYAREMRSDLDHFTTPITSESGGYLIRLLNPSKNASEISDINSKIAQIRSRQPHAVTPLLIPLTHETKLSGLIQESHVKFDLDGLGARICYSWITPRAGWLVFDKTNSGKVTSGTQLIGGVTFWVFWKDGYEVLSALDDNHDGKLMGPELERLSIWSDSNTDGVSQPGEVKPLSYWHITELSCRPTTVNKQWLSSTKGVTFEDGSQRPSYDVMITQEPLKK